MDTNRIRAFLPDPTATRDHWEVRTISNALYVTPDSGRRLAQLLADVTRHEWIVLEGIGGSAVHLRTDQILYVREWTQDQRERARTYWRAVEDEEYDGEAEVDEGGGPPS